MKRGDLMIGDNGAVVMVVDIYPGLYGRLTCDVVRAHRDITAESATEYWAQPLGYFADELTPVTADNYGKIED